MFECASSASTRGRVLAAEDRVAQLGREPPQHRGAHQKVPGLGRERGQNLVGQIVGDVPSAAGERPHTLIGVLEITKPQRRQIQPRGPSLGPLDEQLDALAGQLDPLAHDQLTRLVDRESQLARANLRQRPSRPQARQADRRVRARRREQTRIRRQPLDRVRDRAKRTLALDRVEVIEHDRYRTAVRDQAVHQLIDGRLDSAHPGRRGTSAPDFRDPDRAARRPSPGASTAAPDHRQPRSSVIQMTGSGRSIHHDRSRVVLP